MTSKLSFQQGSKIVPVKWNVHISVKRSKTWTSFKITQFSALKIHLFNCFKNSMINISTGIWSFATNWGCHFHWRSAHVQPRAPPCSARQSIFLINEMLFDYLIDNISQKLVKLESVENNGKKKHFEKFQIFQFFFFDFQQILFFSYLLSYNINQVVRKYLLDQENRLAHTKWARALIANKNDWWNSIFCHFSQ